MNSFILKMIACLTMLIDHAAIVFYSRLPGGMYWVMRGVGRLAFVIFCFFIAEGFTRTRSRVLYALRLALFALLCEIPFDLLCFGWVMDLSHQNVYVTLLLGLLGLWGYEALRKQNLSAVGLLCPIGCAALAELLCADYGAGGVLLIAVIYLLRKNKVGQGIGVLAVLGSMCIGSSPLQLLGIVGWLLCLSYNGQLGPKIKYAFYAFYPLHMLGLHLLRYIL